jgi:hypothetical protein
MSVICHSSKPVLSTPILTAYLLLSISMLSTPLNLILPSGHFINYFTVKFLYVFLVSLSMLYV